MTDLRKLVTWFAGNDTGISSICIAAHMSGVSHKDIDDIEAPSDPNDLGRCLRLLELFPEWKARMPEMATLDARWKTASENWVQIERSMTEEVGINWSKGRKAPVTYALMKKLGL